MRHRLLALIASALLGAAVVATTAAAAPLPVLYNGLVGYAHASATASPPGANDWSCKPGPTTAGVHPVACDELGDGEEVVISY
jgi:hypothetical protein